MSPGAPGTATGPARGLHAEHPCPQCGGGVDIEETDRLLSCPYCRVKLYMIPNGRMFSFSLPPRPGSTSGLVYAPYWRVRGPVFLCANSSITHRVIDTTMPALKLKSLPKTLGMRPQAMKLNFALPHSVGKFLAPSTPRPGDSVAGNPLLEESEESTSFYQCLLAVTSSIVYLPLRVEKDGAIYDAVRGDQILFSAADQAGLSQASRSSSLGINFLPLVCPDCGWDMKAARDSLVMLCAGCRSTWETRGDRLARTDCASLRVTWEPQIHLPFWRTRVQVRGCTLESFADLAKIANLPIVTPAAQSREELYIWAPAFKVPPAHLLRLARTLTIREPANRVNIERGVPRGDCHPVSVPAAAVEGCAKLVIADLMTPKTAWFPKLPGIAVTAQGSQLVYVPFQAAGAEWTHPGASLTLMRTMLELGRSI